MKQEPKNSPGTTSNSDTQPLDVGFFLNELAQRWRGTQTLEYRSEAVLNHAGEFRVTVKTHALLRRPSLARVTFLADPAEFSQLRVCDGRRLFARGASTAFRRASTTAYAYTGRLTENIPHPLDEISSTLDQFFARFPFAPPVSWGSSSAEALKSEASRQKRAHPVTGKEVPVIRIRFSRGAFEDLLFVEPISLRPLEFIRTGDHAGIVQKLLHETFVDFRLGPNLPASLFRWTNADEKGETLR